MSRPSPAVSAVKDGSLDRPTLLGQALNSAVAVGLASRLPVPLAVARPFLVHDNRQENRRDSWGRLRSPQETSRYHAVKTMTERHARDGFVLDVGCSQGLLQEGLTYGRYVGVDHDGPAIARASVRADQRTLFVHCDADSFEPDRPADAIVLNEVLYYLPRPMDTVRRYAQLLAPDGVLIVSLFRHAWATRRLMGRIATALPVVDSLVVAGPAHLAWVVSVHTAPRARDASPT